MLRKLLLNCSFLFAAFPSWSQNYCTPTPTDCSKESVLRTFMTFGGIDNVDFSSASCFGTGFSFETDDTLRIRRGDSIQFIVGSNNVIPYGYYVWVDWDGNGSYQDPGEFVFNTEDLSYNKPYPIIRQGDGTFHVPNNATLGHTRIRVLVYQSVRQVGVPGSCVYPDFGAPGQTRDFVVEIVPSGGNGCIINPIQATVKVLEHYRCIGDTVLLYSTTGINPNNTYQWQSAPSSGGPYTDIPDANRPYLFSFPTQNTFYRLRVTCGAQTSTTTAFDVRVRTSPLNGNYTINNLLMDSPTNFSSITKAARTLRCVGMDGPVTLTVNPNSNPYRGHIILANITNPNNDLLLIEGNDAETRPYRGLYNRVNVLGPKIIINNSHNITVKNLKIIVPEYHMTTTVTVENANDILFENCLFQTADISRANVRVIGGSNLRFSESTFLGGIDGIHSTDLTENIHIEKSLFNNQRAYGIRCLEIVNAIIDSNQITATNRNPSTGYTALTCIGDGAEVRNNIIHGVTNGQTNNLHEITLMNLSVSGNAPFRVYNNLMHDNVTRGKFTGIRIGGGGNNAFVAHNTVHFERKTGFTSLHPWLGLHIDNFSGDLKILNNIFETDRQTSSTHFVYGAAATGSLDMDYNIYNHPDFVKTTMYFSDFGSVKQNTFSDWQSSMAGIGNETNSIFQDPKFADKAAGDFTPQHPDLASSNRSISIPRDLYGSTRSTTPSIGAIEFSPPLGVDPLIARLDLDSAVCSGPFPITVVFDNFGAVTTDSLWVDLYLNGVFHQTYSVTTPIPTGTPTSVVLDQINITPSTSYDMEFIITDAFPGPDMDTTNNHYAIDGVRSMLSGTYTINRTIPASGTNFTSHSKAIEALIHYGICGPVVINTVAFSGPYTEILHITEIPGSSPVNTVTFAGNNNLLQPNANYGTHMAMWHIEKVSYLEINGFRINTTNSSINPLHNDALLISNQSKNITIKNCSITMPVPLGSFSTNLINITGDRFIDGHIKLGDSITIEGCTFHGSENAINVLGNNTPASGIYIIDNTFSKNHQPVTVKNQNQVHVQKNHCSLAGDCFLKVNNIFDLYIEQNEVFSDLNKPSSFPQTNRGYNLDDIKGEVYIHNNLVGMISASNNNFKINTTTAQISFYHNTLLAYNPGCFNCYALELSSSGSATIDIQNNIFVRHTGNQSAFYRFPTPPQGFTSDNNIYYSYHHTPIDVPMVFNVTSANTFDDWQNTNGGPNDMYQNPVLFNFMQHDLTPTAKRVSQKGNNSLTPGIGEDVFSASRKSPPDPGAIEFIPYPCQGILTKQAHPVDSLVNVYWTSTEDYVDLTYGPTGFTPGTGGTVINNLDGEEYVINGLNAGDCIDIYLREQCHSGSQATGNWEGPIEICIPHNIDLEIAGMPQHNPVCDDGTGNRNIPVVIHNAGLEAVTGFTLKYNTIGIKISSDSLIHIGTILPGDSLTLYIPFSDLQDGGRFTVSVTVSINNDGDLSNNSMSVPYYIIPHAPKPMQVTLCPNDPGPVKLYGDKYPGVGYVWYDLDTAEYRFFIGDEDTLVIAGTPPVGQTFYVEYFSYQALYGLYSTLKFSDAFVNNTNLHIRSEEYDLNKGSDIDPSCPGLYTINHDPYLLVNGVSQFCEAESYNGGLINEIYSQFKLPQRNLSGPAQVGGRLSIPGNSYHLYSPPAYEYRFNPTGEIFTELHLGRLPDGTGCNSQFQRVEPGKWESEIEYIYIGCSTIRVPITIETTPPPQAGFDFVENTMRGFFTSTAVDADSVYFEVITLGLGGKPGGYVTFDFPAVGNYLVCQYVYNECGADTICEWIEIKNTAIGIDKEKLSESITVFPNPSEGPITIRGEKFAHAPTNITITDAVGNTIEKRYWDAELNDKKEATFNLEHLAAGIYLIHLEQGGAKVVKKWVKL